MADACGARTRPAALHHLYYLVICIKPRASWNCHHIITSRWVTPSLSFIVIPAAAGQHMPKCPASPSVCGLIVPRLRGFYASACRNSLDYCVQPSSSWKCGPSSPMSSRNRTQRCYFCASVTQEEVAKGFLEGKPGNNGFWFHSIVNSLLDLIQIICFKDTYF